MKLFSALLYACLLSGVAVAQNKPAPKLTPEQVNLLRMQEKELEKEVTNSKKLPTFTVQQCRSDAQEWTLKEPPPWMTTLIVVNGQVRMMSPITPHTPITKLLDRIYEMTVCETVDADFEKQFHTYSQMHKSYQQEQHSRYALFLMKHELIEQFLKEDAKENE